MKGIGIEIDPEVAAAARRWDMPGVEKIPNVVEAARRALAIAGPDDIVCLTGSFYTVGDISPARWAELLAERAAPAPESAHAQQ